MKLKANMLGNKRQQLNSNIYKQRQKYKQMRNRNLNLAQKPKRKILQNSFETNTKQHSNKLRQLLSS